MRLVVAVVAGLLALAGSAQAASWKITKDHWDAADEEGFGRFVIGFGESDCQTPEACFKSTANPYRDTDPPELRMDGDCADFIFQMRAYYAWKNGLPFSYPLFVMSRSGPVEDNRFSPAGNMIVARLQLEWQAEADPVDILRALRGVVSTAMFRVENSYDRGFSASDFYSPKIERGAIRAGTVIYDPWGHVVYVYKIDDDGTIHYVDSNPDRIVTRGKFGPQFPRDKPALSAGFQNFRPIKLVDYTTAADGSLINGKFVLASNTEIPDFSTEQFYGTDPKNTTEWKSPQFLVEKKPVGFYDFVRARMASR